MDLHRYRLHLAGAGLVLLSILLMLLYMELGPKQPTLARRLSQEFAPLPISAESLFLPSEPPIIPEVILSREPRTAWTEADAREFWVDPRSFEQAPLEIAAKKEADALYASVP